jgi:cellulose synthase/poly-beta-1,6-N-acetylglucosamine synthase-like glycosyltransferase
MDITIAICTYNGAEDVPDVLDHLQAQEEVNHIQWEVIVVDNNSTDSTESVVREYQKDWKREAPLRYTLEKRQGKSYAMETAVAEGRGEWIAFLDDDNLPASDWVAAAHRFTETHPQAGAFGGQVHGDFEAKPPKSFGLVKPLFALNERSEEVCYSAGESMTFAAPGAGLVVQKLAWKESVPETGLELKGPTGDSRGTLGEEFELQWRLYEHDWEIWHNPNMHLGHAIPEERFEEEYLEDFFKAIGISRHSTRMMRLKPWQRPLAVIGYWIADFCKLVRLGWVQGSNIFTDRFVRGRALVIVSSLAAPLLNGGEKRSRY